MERPIFLHFNSCSRSFEICRNVRIYNTTPSAVYGVHPDQNGGELPLFLRNLIITSTPERQLLRIVNLCVYCVTDVMTSITYLPTVPWPETPKILSYLQVRRMTVNDQYQRSPQPVRSCRMLTRSMTMSRGTVPMILSTFQCIFLP